MFRLFSVNPATVSGSNFGVELGSNAYCFLISEALIAHWCVVENVEALNTVPATDQNRHPGMPDVYWIRSCASVQEVVSSNPMNRERLSCSALRLNGILPPSEELPNQ